MLIQAGKRPHSQAAGSRISGAATKHKTVRSLIGEVKNAFDRFVGSLPEAKVARDPSGEIRRSEAAAHLGADIVSAGLVPSATLHGNLFELQNIRSK
ncbi:MAG: hypothetical protein ACWGOD_08710 [Desulfobulbales bacterium]